MASRLQVAPDEYLSMSFPDLDREYVRGEIVERSMPDLLHAKMQIEIGYRFRALRDSHRLFAYSDCRMRLAPDLYRIPDIAVFSGAEPDERVPSRPALVVIEIISPDDRYSDVLEKLGEYQQWGVPNIWLVDPYRRTLMIYSAGTLATVDKLTLPDYPLELTADLFS